MSTVSAAAVEGVLAKLKAVRHNGRGWIARCPAHDDGTPSLSITAGDDGRVILYCHAGCATPVVVAGMGLTMADLFPPDPHRSHASSIGVMVEKYSYTDEAGQELYQVCRYEPKAFRQRRRGAQGEWIWKLGEVRRVPYRLPQVLAAVRTGKRVCIVEGEKDVHSLADHGLIATTNPGGAGKWRREYGQHFRGARLVIFPDNDDAGRDHARQVATALHGIAADIRVVELPDAPLKGDVTDWLCAGGTTDALRELLGATPRWEPAAHTPLNGSDKALAQRPLGRPRSEERRTEDPFPNEEPWPSDVDGAALLDSLCQLLRSYLVLPAHAADVIALWIAHTYMLDCADFTPYLWVSSPARECGKSTVLELIVHLAFRAQLTGGITAAALYRRIDRLRPTMLLDELDARLRTEAGETLRGVLDTGFHRTGKVTICVGDAHQDRDFSTYCPKVLAGIGRLWDTVTSRSIPIRLQRATRAQLALLKKIRGDRINDDCQSHRRQLLRWSAALREPLRVADPVTPDELGARQCDVWRPLFAIADQAGGRWPDAGRRAALALHGVAEDEGDDGLLLLSDVRDLFTQSPQPKLSSAFIADELAKLDDRPWPEYRNGKPITTTGIARLLKRFGVKSKNVRSGLEVTKGYELAELKPVFDQYLVSPEKAATAATSAGVAAVAQKNDVAVTGTGGAIQKTDAR